MPGCFGGLFLLLPAFSLRLLMINAAITTLKITVNRITWTSAGILPIRPSKFKPLVTSPKAVNTMIPMRISRTIFTRILARA